MSLFHRLCHLKDTPLVKAGEWVKRGQLIGYCGTSGQSSGPHCHYDIFNQPNNWTIYTSKMSMAKVKSIFTNPAPYIKNKIPMDNTYPLSGYGFMQWVRNPGYYHAGIDCNGMNDLGKPIYSPVEGRVRYVAGTTWVRNWLRRLIPRNWNSGFGNFVVIEESPGFDIKAI